MADFCRLQQLQYLLEVICPILDYYMCRLENFTLLGGFNSEITENAMKEFCDAYNLKNLITEATCFKNPINPSSIDLILTNKIRSFQNTTILETGLSDHHQHMFLNKHLQ